MKPADERSLVAILRSVHALHDGEVFRWHDSLEAVHVVVPGDDPNWLILLGAQSGFESMVCIAGAEPRSLIEQFGCFDAATLEGPDCAWPRIFAEVVPLDVVPPDQRRLLTKAGIATRRESVVPHLIFMPGAATGAPKLRGNVLRSLDAALAALVIAARDPYFTPRAIGYGGDLAELHTDGNRRGPQVDLRWRSLVFEDCAGDAETLGADQPLLAELANRLEGVPSVGGERSLGAYLAPGAPGESPLPVLLGVKEEGRLAWLVTALEEPTLLAAAESVVEALSEGEPRAQLEPGLPAQLLIASAELRDVLAALLEPLGVECIYEPSCFDLELRLALVFGAGVHLVRSPADQPRHPGLPAADDLEAWKSLDLSIYPKIDDYLARTNGDVGWFVERYFGSEADARLVAGSAHGANAFGALHVYAFAEHRELPMSATLAERVLASPLPAHERVALGSRVLSSPAFYRVTAVDPGSTLSVEDVLDGERVLLHDRALSECVSVGHVLILRLLRLGDFVFPAVAGPAIAPADVEAALEFMDEIYEAEGGDPDDEEEREEATHLFGRLWCWSLSRPAFEPRLTNNDGDDLLFHTAAFVVQDGDGLERALKRRDDIVYAPDELAYLWLADDADDPTIMGRTRLARLQVFPGEVVVEVNSAPRLERVRAWLEQIPGVAFESAQVKTIKDLEGEAGRGGAAGIPLDDRLNPAPAMEWTPELIAVMQQSLDAYCMAWLDIAIPALDGRTPRQAAAADRAGRTKVLRLIQTMPMPFREAAAGPGEDPRLHLPRERMLKELGLD